MEELCSTPDANDSFHSARGALGDWGFGRKAVSCCHLSDLDETRRYTGLTPWRAFAAEQWLCNCSHGGQQTRQREAESRGEDEVLVLELLSWRCSELKWCFERFLVCAAGSELPGG